MQGSLSQRWQLVGGPAREGLGLLWTGPGGKDGVWPGWGGCSWWEQQLPPLTSTGGQCNIKVPPDRSARTPCRGPWVQKSGSASYVWNCWWAGTRPGGLGMHSHLRINFVCCLFCFDFRVSEGAY